jgi:hypothetical protein
MMKVRAVGQVLGSLFMGASLVIWWVTTRHNPSSGPGCNVREPIGDRQSGELAVAFTKVNR